MKVQKAVNDLQSMLEEKSLHILIIPSWYPTPENPISGIFFREQAHALKNKGHEVGVISLFQHPFRVGGDYRFFKREITCEDDNGIPTYRYNTVGWFWRFEYCNRLLFFKAGDQLLRNYIAEHGKPDIIHAHSALMGGVMAAHIKMKYNIPYVITEHSSTYARGLIKYWQTSLVKETFQNAGARIVVSPELGKLLETKIGPVVNPWLWVPNIVNSSFKPASVPNSSQYVKVFSFLNIALMTDKKGQLDLLHAFANQFKGNMDVQLRLGGDGPIRKNLERSTFILGIDKQVVFLGMLDRMQVLEEMRNCDAFVLASHYETFGIVLIEALACGKPVIATACGGPECIVNENNGALVSPGNADAMASAMDLLMKNINSYNAVSIRNDCIARFGEKTVVSSLSNIYHDICNYRYPHMTLYFF